MLTTWQIVKSILARGMVTTGVVGGVTVTDRVSNPSLRTRSVTEAADVVTLNAPAVEVVAVVTTVEPSSTSTIVPHTAGQCRPEAVDRRSRKAAGARDSAGTDDLAY